MLLTNTDFYEHMYVC